MAWLDGTVIERIAWTDTHISLRIDCECPHFIAGQFIRVALDIDGERIARPYSCVNAPDAPYIEIFFNLVSQGELSAHLAALQAGDHIFVSDRCSGFLTLEELPETVHRLWMIATGTGVGPFLSMLQTDAAWQKFDRLILAYGVHQAEQLAYPELLAQLKQDHDKLLVIPCVTQNPSGDAYPGRVTQALAGGELEARVGCEINPEADHFMLCGNTQMIQEMSEALKERGLRKHLRRTPGHISSEKYH